MKAEDWAVEVEGLTVRFGDFKAVDGVSFKVAKGEIFGFLGANGAGKTTTIRVLCGLLRPDAGHIAVGGQGFGGDNSGLKRKSGYMSQKFTLYTDMSVAENLAFAAALRGVGRKELAVRKAELFAKVGFDRPENTLVADLPGGLKQQVSLAAALLHQPQIVFLDEPTAGVDPASRARFWAIIRSLAAEGQTVFVTTHYMDEAEQCGRIALMRDGQLVALDSPAGLKAQAFPHGMLEVEVGPRAAADWPQAWRRDKDVAALKPHGRRWHLEPRTKAGAARLSEKRETGLRLHPLQPSLEDVFLKIVEPPPAPAAAHA